MVKVNVRNNFEKSAVMVDENTTVRTILTNAGIDYSRYPVSLDGAPLRAGDFDKSLAQYGITSECFLVSVNKADNA